MAIKPKEYLSIQVPCPTSGLVLEGKKIETHFLELFKCVGGGTLSAYCRVHGGRIFLDNPNVVLMILKVAKPRIVDVKV